MKTSYLLLPIALLLVIGLASCSMKQEIYIEKDGSGSVKIDMRLADYLTKFISQVQSALDTENPQPEGTPFFNLEALSEDFAGRKGVSLESIESPTETSLVGSFSFDNLNALYQELDSNKAESRLIDLRSENGISELAVSVTKETIDALLAENPSLNNPLISNFGPSANAGLSEEDYLSMMEFALGAESRKGILESSLKLTVSVEGTIIDQQGGTLIDNSTVLFEIPLLPVLLMNETLNYSLRYQ